MENLNKIEAYLFGRLNQQEHKDFENECNSDAKLKQELYIFKAILLGGKELENKRTLEKIKEFKQQLDQEDLELIERFVLNDLIEEDVTTVRERIQRDSAFAAKVKHHKAIILGLKGKSENKALNKIKGFKEKLDQEEKNVPEIESAPKQPIFRKLFSPKSLAIAASLVFLVVCWNVFRNNDTIGQEIFLAYAEQEEILSQETAFLNEELTKYQNSWNSGAEISKKVYDGIQNIVNDKEDLAIQELSRLNFKTKSYYLGLAHWKKEDYKSAKNAFLDYVAKSNLKPDKAYFYSKWYLALIYLNEGNIDEAKLLIDSLVMQDIVPVLKTNSLEIKEKL